jgi:hypothetical protein
MAFYIARPSPLPCLVKELPNLHPQSFASVPQRHDRRIALAQFQAADVGPIHPYALIPKDAPS